MTRGPSTRECCKFPKSRSRCTWQSGVGAGSSGALLHLGVEADFRAAKKAHPAFIVDELSSLSVTLSNAGFPVRSEEPLEGYTRVYVDDPFGNRLELMEPLDRNA